MSATEFYNHLSEDYDRFVNWPARLAFELPFFQALFAEHGVREVLDVACGTGHHAIALAREGYTVTATDISPAMVAQAQANAHAAGVEVQFHNLGFGDLAEGLSAAKSGARFSARFGAVLCLGNSLPHVLTEEALQATLRDFAAVLRPEGMVVIQNRNFDRVMRRRERFMSPEVHRQDDREWIFVRFYDFLSEDALQFNMVRLQRGEDGAWVPQVNQTHLRPWRYAEWEQQLQAAGLSVMGAYGSYNGEPFNAEESGDLILVARRDRG